MSHVTFPPNNNNNPDFSYFSIYPQPAPSPPHTDLPRPIYVDPATLRDRGPSIIRKYQIRPLSLSIPPNPVPDADPIEIDDAEDDSDLQRAWEELEDKTNRDQAIPEWPLPPSFMRGIPHVHEVKPIKNLETGGVWE